MATNIYNIISETNSETSRDNNNDDIDSSIMENNMENNMYNKKNSVSYESYIPSMRVLMVVLATVSIFTYISMN